MVRALNSGDDSGGRRIIGRILTMKHNTGYVREKLEKLRGLGADLRG